MRIVKTILGIITALAVMGLMIGMIEVYPTHVVSKYSVHPDEWIRDGYNWCVIVFCAVSICAFLAHSANRTRRFAEELSAQECRDAAQRRQIFNDTIKVYRDAVCAADTKTEEEASRVLKSLI